MITLDRKIQFNTSKNNPIKNHNNLHATKHTPNKGQYPKLSQENWLAYCVAFTSEIESFEKFVTKNVKSYHGKDYIGAGLYKKDVKTGKQLDYILWEDKIGWDKLKNNQLDWNTAKSDDVLAFWHALALAETNDTTWPKRYNPENVKEPLATYHSITSATAKNYHQKNLKKLSEILSEDKTLLNKLATTPAINQKTGKLNFEFTVFDTETTGLNITSKKPLYPVDEDVTELKNNTLDKILQIGALKYNKNGDIVEKSALNQLINPDREISEEASNVHGIYHEDVKDKPVIGNLLRTFHKKYLGKDLIVAYNAKFDIPLLNNSIRELNAMESTRLKEKDLALVLDPFILLQRIHPFVGAKKQLSEQHKFLFCREFDGAHDAFSDVKATAEVLKYCINYMQKHSPKPLSILDVLLFQHGDQKYNNVGIKINNRGYDENKNFEHSYKLYHIGVDRFFNGYKISKPNNYDNTQKNVVEELAPIIGAENIKLLQGKNLFNTLINDKEFDHTINPKETMGKDAHKNKTQKTLVNQHYVMEDNFRTVLLNTGLKGYKELSKEAVIDAIVDKSKNYIKENYVDVWIKNPNPSYIKKGNDLPDIEVARKVMLESINAKEKTRELTPRELSDIVKQPNKK